jgi:hypothetical protein
MADTPEADLDPQDTRRPRRRGVLALWGVLAALAVGIGAVAVLAGDDDPPKLPIALGGAAGDGRATAEADAPAGDAAMTMLAWVRYVAGDDLPALGGAGPAHRLSNAVDPDRLEAVAAVLGLDGELREEPESPGTWTITAADGSTLSAGPYGGGGWWYSSGALMSSGGGSSGSSGSGGSGGSAGCAPDDTTCQDTLAREREAAAKEEAGATDVVDPCPADTECTVAPTPAPEPVVPPADLPSEAEAEARALDLFRGLGVDVEGAAVTVEGPSDAWYVSIEPRVDGMVVSGYVFNAAIGSNGDITTAGGVLNRPEHLGDYPTVDTRAAIDRLNEQTSGYGGGREPGIAYDTGTSDVDCAAATGVAEAEAEARDGAALDPAVAPSTPVCEAAPPTEPTEVVLHEAERILLLVPGFQEGDDSYLVPGYRFRSDETGWVDVIAVDDGSLLPPPATDQPQPMPLPEPDPGPTTVVEPGGTPGCAPVEPGPDGAVPDICLDPDSPVESPVGEP